MWLVCSLVTIPQIMLSLSACIVHGYSVCLCALESNKKSQNISRFCLLNSETNRFSSRLFLSCLSAALATALSFLAFCLYPFIMFIIDKTSIMNQRGKY